MFDEVVTQRSETDDGVLVSGLDVAAADALHCLRATSIARHKKPGSHDASRRHEDLWASPLCRGCCQSPRAEDGTPSFRAAR